MSDNQMLDAALEYAKEGFYIIPLHVASELENGVYYCTCGSIGKYNGEKIVKINDAGNCNGTGKHPYHHPFYLPNGLNSASNDHAKATTWWNRWQGANIGCNLKESHLWVLDVDGEEGKKSFDKLTDKYGALPDTRIVNTGRGYHFYFCNWMDHVKSGTLDGAEYPEIHIKGEGGYTILPPSRHYTGRRYAYANKNDPVDAPDWLLNLVKQPERSPIKATTELKKNLSAIPITAILNEKELSCLRACSGGILRGSHPWHGSTTGTNFQIDVVKGEWYCWRHQAWGRLLEMVAMKSGLATCENFTRRGRTINVLSGKNYEKVIGFCFDYGIKPEDLAQYTRSEP